MSPPQLRLVHAAERSRDPVRLVADVTLRQRWLRADTGISVDGDLLTVALPGQLAEPLVATTSTTAVALVPDRLRDATTVFSPLVVPSFSGLRDATVVLLFDEPVRLPPLRRRMEVDAHLPFDRARTLSDDGVVVDGLLLPADDPDAAVQELHAAGVRPVHDVVGAVARRRRTAEALGRDHPPEPPASHVMVGLGLHALVLAELAAFWPLEATPAVAWPTVAATLAAAIAARPVLARHALARQQRQRAAEDRRRAHLARFE